MPFPGWGFCLRQVNGDPLLEQGSRCSAPGCCKPLLVPVVASHLFFVGLTIAVIVRRFTGATHGANLLEVVYERTMEAIDPKAFRALLPKLTKAARAKNPAAAKKILESLARHGDTLPVEWRKLLVELTDEPELALTAAVGLAQVKPHRSMVMPMVRRIAAKLDACAATKDFAHSWDDEIALAVLAKCADERAAAVLIALLEAPKVAHWDLLLAACVQADAPELAPAIRAWLRRAKKNGVSPKWDGYSEGHHAVQELTRP